jgi:hypothetical protein
VEIVRYKLYWSKTFIQGVIAVGVSDVVECAAASYMSDCATGGSGNLSTSLSNVASLAAHPKFLWVFNANCNETIIYNDSVWFNCKKNSAKGVLINV